MLLTFKTCKHGHEDVPSKRWVKGVQLWLRDLLKFAGSLPVHCRWHAPMREIVSCVADWWPQFLRHLPTAEEIEVMAERSWEAALATTVGNSESHSGDTWHGHGDGGDEQTRQVQGQLEVGVLEEQMQ